MQVNILLQVDYEDEDGGPIEDEKTRNHQMEAFKRASASGCKLPYKFLWGETKEDKE